MKANRFFPIIVVAIAALIGCNRADDGDDSSKVNGSVHIAAGKPPGPAATVNGSVHIDDNAAVTTATTVNGSIHLGAHATAVSLDTVNGGMSVDTGAHVSGNAAAVNGDLTVGDGADITGAVSNVNGKITLTAAHVGGGIKTVGGSIDIEGASRVEGGILVEKSTGHLFNLGNEVPRIVVGPGANVQGELRFERQVQLYVSDKATIGAVTGATAIAFTGDKPPR
jgi:DUF4097 and DUF4098 domain-containing protein YvlB